MRWAPGWAIRMIRAYVAWSERGVKISSVTLRLPDINCALRHEPSSGLEILPLSQCGDEWLLRRVFNHAASGAIGFRRARAVDMIAFASAPGYTRESVLLARLDGRYVGTCVARRRADGIGMIYSLAVASEARRRGVGRALLRTALQRLQAEGAVEAQLYAHPDNHSALTLYRSEGFRELPKMDPDCCRGPRPARNDAKRTDSHRAAAFRRFPARGYALAH